MREKPSGGTHGDPRDTGLPSSSHALGAVYPRTYAHLPVTAQLPQWIRQGQPRPSGQGPSSVIEVCPDLKNGIHTLYYSSYAREDITDKTLRVPLNNSTPPLSKTNNTVFLH